MAAMAKSPGQKYFSISPTDAYGFCQCDSCQALDEPCDWEGWKTLPPGRTASITRRMLTFYNAVAKIVGRRYPDKVLGGMVYDLSTYPPLERMKLEPNLFIQLAPAQYYGGALPIGAPQPAWTRYPEMHVHAPSEGTGQVRLSLRT